LFDDVTVWIRKKLGGDHAVDRGEGDLERLDQTSPQGAPYREPTPSPSVAE
jgi:hypothetical protein